MKKRRISLAAVLVTLALVGLPPIGVWADTAAARETSAVPQRVFDTPPTLPNAAAGGVSFIGAALWCVVILAAVAVISYLIVNTVRRVRQERMRSEKELIRPQLIISEAYKQK